MLELLTKEQFGYLTTKQLFDPQVLSGKMYEVLESDQIKYLTFNQLYSIQDNDILIHMLSPEQINWLDDSQLLIKPGSTQKDISKINNKNAIYLTSRDFSNVSKMEWLTKTIIENLSINQLKMMKSSNSILQLLTADQIGYLTPRQFTNSQIYNILESKISNLSSSQFLYKHDNKCFYTLLDQSKFFSNQLLFIFEKNM